MKPVMIALLIGASALGVKNLPKGQFFFEENGISDAGSPYAVAGTFTLDGQGYLQGTETLKGLGQPATLYVKGSYSLQPDGTGTMTIQVPFPDPDSDSGVSYTTNSYVMIMGPHGMLKALRTEANILSEATLSPLLNAAALKGSFVVT